MRSPLIWQPVVIGIVAWCVTTSCQASTSYRERLAEIPTWEFVVRQLTPAGKAILDRLLEAADSTGQTLPLDKFVEMLLENKAPLSEDDDTNLHFLYGQMQRGPISQADLLALRKAQRGLLSSIRAEYTVAFAKENRPAPHADAPPRTFETTFAMDGVRLYLRRETFSEGSSLGTETIAYDGEVVRRYLAETSKLPYSSIDRFQGRREFIQPGNPLLAAKLLNYHSDLDEETATDDLTQILGGHYVFEEVHERGGHRCVLIGDAFEQAFLAIDLGYALVEYHAGDLSFDSKSGQYSRTDSYNHLENGEFEEVAENLWLPKRFHFTSVSKGAPYYEYDTQVDTYSVNDPPSKELFEEIIPDGTFVADAIQDATYRLGGNSEGPGAAGEAEERSASNFLWLVLLNVVVVGILAALFVRSRIVRRAK